MTSKLLLAALLASLALLTAPAYAQRITENYQYQTATASGCTALFLRRQTYDGGIAGNAIAGYGWWMKLQDTCGTAPNDTVNWAGMGYCTTGVIHDSAWCSVSGVVLRTWRVHANCGRELLTQMDGAAYTGQPTSACVGTPIN